MAQVQGRRQHDRAPVVLDQKADLIARLQAEAPADGFGGRRSSLSGQGAKWTWSPQIKHLFPYTNESGDMRGSWDSGALPVENLLHLDVEFFQIGAGAVGGRRALGQLDRA